MLEEQSPKRQAIEMHKICFSYHPTKPFIHNLSLSLEESKYYCIIGHNGSGKSTFSKLLTGLLKPQSGYIRIFDQSISKIGYQRIFSCLGVVFQNPDSQFITSSIEEELAFGLENKKVPRHFMKEIVSQLIDSMDLYALKDKSPSTLSGGQKQKVAIASVLAFNPALFLFDESSSMLSPIEKVEIVQLMKKLSSDYKKTVISITHDMEELLFADEIIIFSHGQIVAHLKDKNELFELPFSFFFELSLNPPFASHLVKTLREEYSWDLPFCYSEEELIENIARMTL